MTSETEIRFCENCGMDMGLNGVSHRDRTICNLCDKDFGKGCVEYCDNCGRQYSMRTDALSSTCKCGNLV